MDKVRELDNLEKDLNQGAATAVYYVDTNSIPRNLEYKGHPLIEFSFCVV